MSQASQEWRWRYSDLLAAQTREFLIWSVLAVPRSSSPRWRLCSAPAVPALALVVMGSAARAACSASTMRRSRGTRRRISTTTKAINKSAGTS